jgi:hypothetical protein
MIVLQNQPSINELRSVIAHVPRYPITAGNLIRIAHNIHASQDVIDFYKGIPSDQIFQDADDLINRTEQLEIMHREDMPYEQLFAAEEY